MIDKMDSLMHIKDSEQFEECFQSFCMVFQTPQLIDNRPAKDIFFGFYMNGYMQALEDNNITEEKNISRNTP